MSLICCYRATSRSALSVAADTTMPPPRPRGFREDLWKEFAHTLKWLRKFCPAAMPVVVKFCRLPSGILGQCMRRPTRFLIRLNDRMKEPQTIDVLVHEWAHALAWNFAVDRLINAPDTDPAEFERACHDEAWGCAYSRVWRVHQDGIKAFNLKAHTAPHGP